LYKQYPDKTVQLYLEIPEAATVPEEIKAELAQMEKSPVGYKSYTLKFTLTYVQVQHVLSYSTFIDTLDRTSLYVLD
jgi:hypothetical protein